MSHGGIPVVAHLGWRPQQARYAGVRTAVVAGRTQDQIDEMVQTAWQMTRCGAVMLLIEQCTAEAAEAIVREVSIPVIGCGAGPACHGQVVVLHDLLGMTDEHPSFVTPLAGMGGEIESIARKWRELVESGRYPKGHPYQMTE